MITFQVNYGDQFAMELTRKLKIIHYAVSMGHHRPLIFYLNSYDLEKTILHFETVSQQNSWNEYAGEVIFRLSVEPEDADDLIADLQQ